MKSTDEILIKIFAIVFFLFTCFIFFVFTASITPLTLAAIIYFVRLFVKNDRQWDKDNPPKEISAEEGSLAVNRTKYQQLKGIFSVAKPKVLWHLKMLMLGNWTVVIIVFYILIYPMGFYAKYYPTISGRVVDDETGLPIKGAGVMVHYELEGGSVGGRGSVGIFDVKERLTGDDGEFRISGGFKFKFPGFYWFASPPNVFLIAPGYKEITPSSFMNARLIIGKNEFSNFTGGVAPTKNMEIRLFKRKFIEEDICNNDIDWIMSHLDKNDAPIMYKIAYDEEKVLASQCRKYFPDH